MAVLVTMKRSPTMPPINGFEIIADYFIEIGYCKGSGMGVEPFGFYDVAGWMQATKNELEPWMATALVKMSRAYVAQLTSNDDEPPYKEQD